jgi:uncharacterized protein (DUF983 family)
MMAPRPAVMVGRGLRKRCSRCGTKVRFRRYFKLPERCGSCGYKFDREEGFFTGVYLVNYGLTAAVLVLSIFGFILYTVATDGGGSTVVFLGIGFVIAIALPIWFYPRAATIWASLNMLMHPLEPEEEADAVTWVAAQERAADR